MISENRYLTKVAFITAAGFLLDSQLLYDNVIPWKRFPFYWPFVREIYPSSVDSHHNGQATRALVCFYANLNGWTKVECKWFETPWCSLWRHEALFPGRTV